MKKKKGLKDFSNKSKWGLLTSFFIGLEIFLAIYLVSGVFSAIFYTLNGSNGLISDYYFGSFHLAVLLVSMILGIFIYKWD